RTAPAGVRAHVRRRTAPSARLRRGDVAPGLPQPPGGLRSPDADVAGPTPLWGGPARRPLMPRPAAQASESAELAVLPFRSPHLRRQDGVASRIDWHPTKVHLRFLQLLRAEAGRVAGRGRAGANAA